jgi:hypothetical protein
VAPVVTLVTIPHVLTVPTFLIRDVTRFATRVAQRVPHVLILPTFFIRDVTRFVTRVTTGVTNEESRKDKHM